MSSWCPETKVAMVCSEVLSSFSHWLIMRPMALFSELVPCSITSNAPSSKLECRCCVSLVPSTNHIPSTVNSIFSHQCPCFNLIFSLLWQSFILAAAIRGVTRCKKGRSHQLRIIYTFVYCNNSVSCPIMFILFGIESHRKKNIQAGRWMLAGEMIAGRIESESVDIDYIFLRTNAVASPRFSFSEDQCNSVDFFFFLL